MLGVHTSIVQEPEREDRKLGQATNLMDYSRDLLPAARSLLLKVPNSAETAPPAGDHVFRHASLQGHHSSLNCNERFVLKPSPPGYSEEL